jgi:flagellar export protein FliJ
MSKPATIGSLGTLLRLRAGEVERLQGEVGRQESERARYRASIGTLVSLAEGGGPSGALAPALALNCGDYKQAVFALADNHRTDLHLHEANMAVSQRRLAQAWSRCELLGKVLEKHEAAYAREQERGQRKREDDIATQSWLAGRGA